MDRANVYYCANLDSSDCSFDFFFYSVYWFYEKGEKGAITLSEETDRLLVGITEEESAIETNGKQSQDQEWTAPPKFSVTYAADKLF